MKYQVIPLIYAANEHFKNTIRFSIEFFEDIEPDSPANTYKQMTAFLLFFFSGGNIIQH